MKNHKHEDGTPKFKSNAGVEYWQQIEKMARITMKKVSHRANISHIKTRS